MTRRTPKPGREASRAAATRGRAWRQLTARDRLRSRDVHRPPQPVVLQSDGTRRPHRRGLSSSQAVTLADRAAEARFEKRKQHAQQTAGGRQHQTSCRWTTRMPRVTAGAAAASQRGTRRRGSPRIGAVLLGDLARARAVEANRRRAEERGGRIGQARDRLGQRRRATTRLRRIAALRRSVQRPTGDALAGEMDDGIELRQTVRIDEPAFGSQVATSGSSDALGPGASQADHAMAAGREKRCERRAHQAPRAGDGDGEARARGERACDARSARRRRADSETAPRGARGVAQTGQRGRRGRRAPQGDPSSSADRGRPTGARRLVRHQVRMGPTRERTFDLLVEKALPTHVESRCRDTH